MTTWIPPEPDDAAYPDPVGGGILLALIGGLAASGAILLSLFVPPVALVWLGAAAVLSGAAVGRGWHVVTATAAAIAMPLAASFLATCLTGYWGFLAPLMLVLAAGLLLVVPLGFAVGRLLRRRLAPAFGAVRAVLFATGVMAVAGWGVLIADAVAPGSCPAGP